MNGFGPPGSRFMAKEVAAFVRGEHQIELGLRLSSTGVVLECTGVVLELGEIQKEEQPRRVWVGVTGEGRGSSLDLGVLLSL